MRLKFVIPALVVLAAAVTGIFLLSLNYFQSEEISKAKGRLSLYRNTVIAELERFSHLTFILARDPYVIATASGADTDRLDERLALFAEQSGLDAIYLMRLDGLTISASNATTPNSFVGQNYSFRPYYRSAREGRQGRFYGIGATTGLPGYFIADPVRDGLGEIIGVIAIKIALSKLENTWQSAGERVLLSSADGIVLLASEQSWRYHTLEKLTDYQLNNARASRQFSDQNLDPLDWTRRNDGKAIIDGQTLIHLTTASLPNGWVLHYFAENDPAATRAWLVTAAAISIVGLGFIVSQLRRASQIGAALRRSVAEETQLRQANEQLAVEIEERRQAENRLERTQDELQRASRLAALGRLAASVTHELGQPIAAMKNHLAAAEISGTLPKMARTPIAGLVDRMEGITRQLKFFARTEAEDFQEVDLREAMTAALALFETNIKEQHIALDYRSPNKPVAVRGNKLRIEQVITNVLRNAIDAMEESEVRRLTITIGSSPDTGWFEIRDSGHGLGDQKLVQIQEPFVTSRESGRGMGLGLAIASGIIEEHQGRMTGHNAEGNGATFRVEIPACERQGNRYDNN